MEMNRTFWQEVEEWVNVLTRSPSLEEIEFQFLKPYHLLTLALELKRRGGNQFDSCMQLPSELMSYAARMKLWEAADIKLPKSLSIGQGSERGKFLPVQKLTDNNIVNKIATQLVQIGVKQNLKCHTVNSLEIMLIELLNNYYDHSDSDRNLYGLACAQSWPRGNLAQIALVDSGVGIRHSLEQNQELHALLKNTNACKLSCDYGITSKPNNGHSGYGLTLAKELMQGNKGNFILISYGEGFAQSGDESESFHISSIWEGTLLILEWNINESLNVSVNDIYNNWPTPEGFDANELF
jgi:anti-sigma regulatory factor (Ser/Thr protein kinase)